MGDISEVLEKTNISFPREIGHMEAETLICHLARRLSVSIDYGVINDKRVETQDGMGLLVHNRAVGFVGNMHSPGIMMEGFRLHPNDFNPLTFNGLKYDTIPGYSISEYRKEVVDLWDRAREAVEEYFAQHKHDPFMEK